MHFSLNLLLQNLEDSEIMPIFAASESTTLPVEQRTRVELFLYVAIWSTTSNRSTYLPIGNAESKRSCHWWWTRSRTYIRTGKLFPFGQLLASDGSRQGDAPIQTEQHAGFRPNRPPLSTYCFRPDYIQKVVIHRFFLPQVHIVYIVTSNRRKMAIYLVIWIISITFALEEKRSLVAKQSEKEYRT